jgi:hypothetical protein
MISFDIGRLRVYLWHPREWEWEWYTLPGYRGLSTMFFTPAATFIWRRK